MEKAARKWRFQDIGTVLGNSFKAILKGEFLLRLNIGQYFGHIVYIFFLLAMAIWISLMIDSTMIKVEKNTQTIKELEIEHNQKTFDVMSLSRRGAVEDMLKGMGSGVKEATKEATILK